MIQIILNWSESMTSTMHLLSAISQKLEQSSPVASWQQMVMASLENCKSSKKGYIQNWFLKLQNCNPQI